MPVGDLNKDETRAIAGKLGLKPLRKVESQDDFFVPDKDYGRFLRETCHLPDRPGEIVTSARQSCRNTCRLSSILRLASGKA